MANALKTEKLDLRLTLSAKQILQAAAQASRRSVSEFVLESALARADDVLPQQERIGLNAEQWMKFQELLDAPPRPAPGMARLLNEPSILDGQ